MLLKRLIVLTLLTGLLVDTSVAQMFSARAPNLSTLHSSPGQSLFEQEALSDRNTQVLREIASQDQDAAIKRAAGSFTLSRRRFLLSSAAALPATGVALSQLPQNGQARRAYTAEQKSVFTEKMQAYLTGLAHTWRDSRDPEKMRLLPYLTEMAQRIDILPPGTDSLPIGVAPLTEPDGAYRINPTTGRMEFILRTNLDLWTGNLNTLFAAQGRVREDLEILLESFIVKEIGTLQLMQANPQSGRNKEILRALIGRHSANPDALTIDDLRDDPFLCDAIDIWTSIAMREETGGYVLQADWVRRAGRSSDDFSRLSASQSADPLLKSWTESLSVWMSVLEPGHPNPYRRAAITHINLILHRATQIASVEPEQLFLARKALLIEVAKGRARLNPQGIVEIPEDPDAPVTPTSFLACLEYPTFFALTTVAMVTRLRALEARLTPPAENNRNELQNPQGLIFRPAATPGQPNVPGSAPITSPSPSPTSHILRDTVGGVIAAGLAALAFWRWRRKPGEQGPTPPSVTRGPRTPKTPSGSKPARRPGRKGRRGMALGEVAAALASAGVASAVLAYFKHPIIALAVVASAVIMGLVVGTNFGRAFWTDEQGSSTTEAWVAKTIDSGKLWLDKHDRRRFLAGVASLLLGMTRSAGAAKAVFIDDSSFLRQIRSLAGVALPSSMPIEEQERVWINDALAVVQQYAEQTQDMDSPLRRAMTNPEVRVGVLKGNANAFDAALGGKRAGHNLAALTFTEVYDNQGRLQVLFTVLDPIAFTSRVRLIKVLGHELAGHVPDLHPGASSLSPSELEISAHERSVAFLVWLADHPEAAHLSPAEVQELRTILLPEERQLLENWKPTSPWLRAGIAAVITGAFGALIWWRNRGRGKGPTPPAVIRGPQSPTRPSGSKPARRSDRRGRRGMALSEVTAGLASLGLAAGFVSHMMKPALVVPWGSIGSGISVLAAAALVVWIVVWKVLPHSQAWTGARRALAASSAKSFGKRQKLAAPVQIERRLVLEWTAVSGILAGAAAWFGLSRFRGHDHSIPAGISPLQLASLRYYVAGLRAAHEGLRDSAEQYFAQGQPIAVLAGRDDPAWAPGLDAFARRVFDALPQRPARLEDRDAWYLQYEEWVDDLNRTLLIPREWLFIPSNEKGVFLARIMGTQAGVGTYISPEEQKTEKDIPILTVEMMSLAEGAPAETLSGATRLGTPQHPLIAVDEPAMKRDDDFYAQIVNPRSEVSQTLTGDMAWVRAGYLRAMEADGWLKNNELSSDFPAALRFDSILHEVIHVFNIEAPPRLQPNDEAFTHLNGMMEEKPFLRMMKNLLLAKVQMDHHKGEAPFDPQHPFIGSHGILVAWNLAHASGEADLAKRIAHYDTEALPLLADQLFSRGAQHLAAVADAARQDAGAALPVRTGRFYFAWKTAAWRINRKHARQPELAAA